MDNISDEIIVKAVEGDQDAFESIYRAYSRFVYNVAWRIVDTHEDAQDVTQEVFICVYRKLGGFRFQSQFKTWICRIAINTAVNRSKKISRIKGKTTAYDEQMHSAAVFSGGEDVSDKEHYEGLISSLLSALNEGQRACVVLRNIEGLNYRDIADALNININTVRSRLGRARKVLFRLRKRVNKNEL